MQGNSGRSGNREGHAPPNQTVTIDSYLEGLIHSVSEHPLVAGLVVKSMPTSFEKGYARITARFVDNSQLHIFEYVDSSLRKIKYAYHYQDQESRMLFRYDNEPHYPGLATFPHHKHLAETGEPLESMRGSVVSVLGEVAQTLAEARGRMTQ